MMTVGFLHIVRLLSSRPMSCSVAVCRDAPAGEHRLRSSSGDGDIWLYQVDLVFDADSGLLETLEREIHNNRLEGLSNIGILPDSALCPLADLGSVLDTDFLQELGQGLEMAHLGRMALGNHLEGISLVASLAGPVLLESWV